MKRLVLLVILAAAVEVLAETVPQQHVTVPSVPGQPNRDTVVRPSGTLKTSRSGCVVQGENPGTRELRARPTGITTMNGPAGAGSPGPISVSTPGSLGAPVLDVAYMTLRGRVAVYEKGASITIVDRSGRKRIVPLAKSASVCDGLRIGDLVALRIPLEESATNGAADRVEKQQPKKAPPLSKFSQAQTPTM
jgi:hypothetical protein